MTSCAHIRVLSICDDDGLRYSRELLLATGGFDTTSVSSNDVWERAAKSKYDLIILCHAVDINRALRVISFIRRRNPQVHTLGIKSLDRILVNESSEIKGEVASRPSMLLKAMSSLASEMLHVERM
jgi:CheY-like chemotaxis protein